ncbi:MAG: hypothetical protein AB1576_01675 [Bacillota bacterium]
MGSTGPGITLETAGVVLMGDDLCRLPYLFCLARTTKGIIRQNIGFSLGVKALALSLVFPGWLTLVMVIQADDGAALVAIANALRLLGVRASHIQLGATAHAGLAQQGMKMRLHFRGKKKRPGSTDPARFAT